MSYYAIGDETMVMVQNTLTNKPEHSRDHRTGTGSGSGGTHREAGSAITTRTSADKKCDSSRGMVPITMRSVTGQIIHECGCPPGKIKKAGEDLRFYCVSVSEDRSGSTREHRPEAFVGECRATGMPEQFVSVCAKARATGTPMDKILEELQKAAQDAAALQQTSPGSPGAPGSPLMNISGAPWLMPVALGGAALALVLILKKRNKK